MAVETGPEAIDSLDYRVRVEALLRQIALNGAGGGGGSGGGPSFITSNTSIAYNAGTSSATTQRVAIATNANAVVFASPQPVSLVSLPALPTGANAIGSITNTTFASTQSGAWNVGVTGSVAVTGTFFPATQPVSSERATVATRTSPASSTTSTVVLASNSSRKAARILNNSTSIFYGLYGSGTASASNYSFVLAPLTASPIVPVGLPSYEDVPANFTGLVSGVWASANGNLSITEFS